MNSEKNLEINYNFSNRRLPEIEKCSKCEKLQIWMELQIGFTKMKQKMERHCAKLWFYCDNFKAIFHYKMLLGRTPHKKNLTIKCILNCLKKEKLIKQARWWYSDWSFTAVLREIWGGKQWEKYKLRKENK